MKIKSLNNYLFRKRVGKYLAENERDKRFINYAQAKTVLLLFESDFSEKNPAIRKIIYSLQQDGKKVCAWGYIDKKEITTAILPDFRILHTKQTDFTEKPVISYINELEEQEFDLLIDLSVTKQLPLQYVALYSRARCKTGAQKGAVPIYDFILDIENTGRDPEADVTTEPVVDELYIFNQIIFYLKSIQSND